MIVQRGSPLRNWRPTIRMYQQNKELEKMLKSQQKAVFQHFFAYKLRSHLNYICTVELTQVEICHSFILTNHNKLMQSLKESFILRNNDTFSGGER